MAILKNLLVNGASRFIGDIYASDLLVSGSTTFSNINGNNISVTGSASAANWFISTGATGWKNSTYGGGIYQNNSHYIKNFGGKSIKIASSHTNESQAPNVVGLYLGNSGTYYFTEDGNLKANTTRSSSIIASAINASNVNVENTLRASQFDMQTISQLGGSLYISPTIKFPTDTTQKLVVTNSGGALTLTIEDSSITSDTMSGIVWTSNSKVKVSGTINGVVTGTMDGIITSISTSSHAITVSSLTGGNAANVATNTYTDTSLFSDLSIMVYERHDSNNDYRVGIWLNCYDSANESSTIRIYDGSTTSNNNPKALLGNMTNANLPTVNGQSPTGFGLFSDNAYLSGVLVATAGSIGGFDLSASAIKTTGFTVSDNTRNAVAFSSADFTRTVAGASRSYLRFAIGANYGVDRDGILYASEAHISGDISVTSGSIYLGTYDQTLGYPFSVTNAGVLNARSGTIGGWTIDPNMIYNYATIADYGGVSGHDVTSRVTVANGTNGQHDFLVVEVNDQGTYTYPFVVRADGELWATNAHITGAVTATSGTFTGTVNANSGTFGGTNGFIVASNKIYSNGKSTATSTNNGIYIGSQEGIYLGAYNSTTKLCPFQVTNAGVLHSEKGTIGGWNITQNALTYEKKETLTTGEIEITSCELGSSRFDASFTSRNSSNVLQYDCDVYIDTSQVQINRAEYNNGSLYKRWSLDMAYNNFSIFYNGNEVISIGPDLGSYGIIDVKSFDQNKSVRILGDTGRIIATGSILIDKGSDSARNMISITSTSTTVDTSYHLKNGHREGMLIVSGANNFGLFDITNNAYVIYSNSSQQVVAPHEFIANSIKTSGSIAAGGTGTNQTGAVHAISSARNIALHANAAGNAGIYDSGHAVWIIRSDSSQNVYIPHSTYVSGDYLYLGTTAATNSPAIICANNKNNVALSTTQSSAGVYHYNGSGTSAKWLIYITTSGTVTANTSDIRYKNIYGNISEYETLTMLRGLDVINFSYKEDEKGIIQNGFKAQQMRDLLKSSGIGYRPYLDIQDVMCEEPVPLYDLDAPEGNVVYSVDYSRFTPLLVSGWQIHDSRIDELESEIASLRSEIAALKRM